MRGQRSLARAVWVLPTVADKMADDDLTRCGRLGEVPPGVDDCRAAGTARRRGSWARRATCDDRPAATLMRPDGKSAVPGRRRADLPVGVVATGPTSSETMSTGALPSDRTLLGGAEPERRTSSGRCRGAAGRIWQTRVGANSILDRSVSAFFRRHHQYARSRRRLAAPAVPTGAGGGGLAASLLAAALLIGCAVAEPRRFHAESAPPPPPLTGTLRAAAPAAARGVPPRRSRSDDIGAGTPCIYEGHIKTDRYYTALFTRMYTGREHRYKQK